MESKSKTTKVASATAAPVPSSARPQRAAAPAPLPAADDPSCEAALTRVIRLARAMALVERPGGGEAPAAAAPALPNQARESLERAIEGLPAEVAQKLRALMIAGRDGKSINEVTVDPAGTDSKSVLEAAALGPGQNGASIADQLRRGHALAWAAALDLEKPIASWFATSPQSLDERAWRSFGKQLAKSEPADWQCLCFLEPGTLGVSRLYLKLAEQAWWSFQAVLDRPSAAVVEKQQRTLSSRKSKGLSTRSLEGVVSQLSSARGRALQRAARAIRARVGEAAAAP